VLLDYSAVLAIYAAGTSKADQRSTYCESKSPLELPEQLPLPASAPTSAPVTSARRHERGFSVEAENVRELSGSCDFQNQSWFRKGTAFTVETPSVIHALRVKPSFRKEIHPSLCVVVMRGTCVLHGVPSFVNHFVVLFFKFQCGNPAAAVAHRRRVFLGPSDTPSFP
jgi:hypothetical protein